MILVFSSQPRQSYHIITCYSISNAFSAGTEEITPIIYNTEKFKKFKNKNFKTGVKLTKFNVS